MHVRAYLRASTKEQDAARAKAQLKDFAKERGLKIAAFYLENESGASLGQKTAQPRYRGVTGSHSTQCAEG